MGSSPVVFHFDYISPYSYLAWQQVPALVARHGRGLEPVPVLFAGLLNHHGQKGPGEIPAKRTYMFRDCIRRAEAFGVPFEPPHSHPFRPLLALRATLLDMPSEVRMHLVDRLFRATWAESLDVSDPRVVGPICEELGVYDALRRASSTETKARLKQTTEDAVARGVFGVPAMLVDDALFWGTDSLPHLAAYLRGDDPLAEADLGAWDAVEPSAQR